MDREPPQSSWREMLLWLCRRRAIFRVTGASMEPTLPQGAVVLVDLAAYRGRLPAEGEVVVARHPRQPEQRIIKRVAAVLFDEGEEPRLILASDNPAFGSDSRAFGAISTALVEGRVSSRLR